MTIAEPEVEVACQADQRDHIHDAHRDQAAGIAVVAHPHAEAPDAQDQQDRPNDELPPDIGAHLRQRVDLAGRHAHAFVRSGAELNKAVGRKHTHLKQAEDVDQNRVDQRLRFAFGILHVKTHPF